MVDFPKYRQNLLAQHMGQWKVSNWFFIPLFLFCRPAAEVEMATEGAVLLLSIFHHSSISSDQLAGMCVVACKDIPHSTADMDGRTLTLPLFRFIDMTFSFAEIEARANFGDAKANLFKSNIKKLLSYLPRPRSRSRSKSRGSVSNLEELQALAVRLSS